MVNTTVSSRAAQIPLMRPRVPNADAVLPRLRQIDESGWYSNFGPQVRELEQRLEELLGVGSGTVISVSSATLGLEGVLASSETLDWVVPSWTFTATVGAAVSSTKRVSFADIRPQDWWLDSDAPARIVVAPFGAWIDPSRWDHGSEVVLDAAASLGAMPQLGSLGDRAAVVFSLGATKVLGVGEGGFVVFGSPERAKRFRQWTKHGFLDDRVSHTVGTNAKLSEVMAAYAHTALDDWTAEEAEWTASRSLATRVMRELGIMPQPGAVSTPTPYWIATFPDEATRDLVEQTLERHSIQTRRWWEAGCHRMPAFTHIERTDLPASEHAAATSLGLPMFRGMTQADVDRIADALAVARVGARSW